MDKRNGALRSAPFLLSANDHCIHRSIRACTRRHEDQLQCMGSIRKLSGIIPARFVRADVVSLIDRGYQHGVDVYVHFSVAGTTLVDQAERLPCKLEGDRGAVRGGACEGPINGVRADLFYPPGRVDKGTIFVIVPCLLQWLRGLSSCCRRRLQRDTGKCKSRW